MRRPAIAKGVRVLGTGQTVAPEPRKPVDASKRKKTAVGSSGARKRAAGPSRDQDSAIRRKRVAPTLPKQTEAAFMEVVRDLAKMFGWRSYHTHDSRRSEPGFPDLVFVRRPRVVFAELKCEGKNPTAEQQAWLDDLTACKQEAYCWRPSDLGRIVGLLR